ncbi:MAG: hypothetical protein VKJ04_09725 [Vampirovibrionales bacterium]|nr:hypothetical protein [Vampirovibrionales bacterium]
MNKHKRPGIFQKAFHSAQSPEQGTIYAAEHPFIKTTEVSSALNDPRHLTFDETARATHMSLPKRLGDLKKLQDPMRFGKARFSTPIYTGNEQ